ncbi:MAG: prepilin-type N-terminal cleavage/methylation domain-containing protein [Planctomycetes bacterium]|nr:prepilin-type N-terminal cleavage/methylation domain-containing protein [Planctomycetota bacterium]
MNARARSGFTLMELMAVMMIIAVLLGVGAGMFRRIDFSDRVARPLVQSVLRSAQNWAVARGTPALVRIDKQAGTLCAEGQLVVGTWHFERLPIVGAFGLDGTQFGGQLVDDGFQGKALSFVGEPARSSVEIAVAQDPAFDLRDGFCVRCALRIQPGASAAVLSIGDVVGLDVEDGGALSAWFVAERLDEEQRPVRGGRIPLRGGVGALVPGRWEQIELSYDRTAFELRVDGVRIASTSEDARVWHLEGPLRISPGQTTFAGALDSLVVSAVGASEVSKLPSDSHFGPDTPTEIYFQPGGGLDRARHPEALRIRLLRDDGPESLVIVQPYGTVE